MPRPGLGDGNLAETHIISEIKRLHCRSQKTSSKSPHCREVIKLPRIVSNLIKMQHIYIAHITTKDYLYFFDTFFSLCFQFAAANGIISLLNKLYGGR